MTARYDNFRATYRERINKVLEGGR
jgi:hypothetical protein